MIEKMLDFEKIFLPPLTRLNQTLALAPKLKVAVERRAHPKDKKMYEPKIDTPIEEYLPFIVVKKNYGFFCRTKKQIQGLRVGALPLAQKTQCLDILN